MTLLPLAQLTEITTGEAWLTAAIGFGLVLIVLAVLALFVKALSAIVSAASKDRKKEKAANIKARQNESTGIAESTAAGAADTAADTGITKGAPVYAPPGSVVLDGVSEQDAAVIMAITSDKTGIPLEKLAFLSVKRLDQDPELINVSEQDAAVIMAITAHRLGKPLNKLEFKSIKLAEE